MAGAPPVTLTVRSTRHGPLLSDFASAYRRVAASSGAGYGVSVQSTALAPNTTADALFALDQAADWTGFTAAAAGFTAPAEGLVYADQAGHIGYQGPAGVPQRAAADDGSRPVPGWTSQYAWAAAPTAPTTELDPVDGYISGEPGTTAGVRAARTADRPGGRLRHRAQADRRRPRRDPG